MVDMASLPYQPPEISATRKLWFGGNISAVFEHDIIKARSIDNLELYR